MSKMMNTLINLHQTSVELCIVSKGRHCDHAEKRNDWSLSLFKELHLIRLADTTQIARVQSTPLSSGSTYLFLDEMRTDFDQDKRELHANDLLRAQGYWHNCSSYIHCRIHHWQNNRSIYTHTYTHK